MTNKKTNMTEAEKQLLIALRELKLATDSYFRKFKVDWSGVHENLIEKGLVEATNIYHLTEEGRAVSEDISREQPALWYWYRDYYLATDGSNAHAAFCERLFGMNLCQHGFADMAQLHKLLEVVDLREAEIALDLGCGNGFITEYISDLTKAHVFGLDYVTEAIMQAKKRTKSKSGCLTFRKGHLDHMDYPDKFFDVILSIDSIYMPSDLQNTVRQMKRILKPKGRIGVYYSYSVPESCESTKELLLAENTPLGEVMRESGFAIKAWDITEENYEHAKLKKKVAEELRSEFEKEDNLFLYENRIAEAEGVIKMTELGNMVRYLYLGFNSNLTNYCG